MTGPVTTEALAGGRCMRREAKAFTCECGQHAWKFFRHKYVLMVDADQADAITDLLWGESASGYAIIHAGRKGVSKNIYLHRILFDPGEMRVDHVNRNKTDNRRVNLRTATQSQNVVNYWRPIPPGSPRKYRGICKSRQPGRWRARIKWEKRCITIGTFSTQEDAARAYDARARELYGEFALCNFPEARDAAE